MLNMKPPEILSMVEEAAGTKMYEAKRTQCLKAIADNETKLNEIDRMLKDDIEPTMERLKGERAAYMEFQKVILGGSRGEFPSLGRSRLYFCRWCTCHI